MKIVTNTLQSAIYQYNHIIHFKTFQTLSILQKRSNESCSRFIQSIIACLPLYDPLKSFQIRTQLNDTENEKYHSIYDIHEEFRRFQIEENWKVCDYNKNYEICKTYSEYLIVPKTISKETVAASAAFRVNGRVPALTWIHPITKHTLLRSSQPKIGFSGKSDDDFILLFTEAGETYLHIFDCRDFVAGFGNKVFKQAGYESSSTYTFCEVEFLNLPNIHKVREEFRQLYELIMSIEKVGVQLPSSSDTNNDSNGMKQKENEIQKKEQFNFNYSIEVIDIETKQSKEKEMKEKREQKKQIPLSTMTSLHQCEWMKNIQSLLQSSQRVSQQIINKSCLIHCSDGWDRTSQICSLVQLLLDPFYRTIKGFIILIEKDFVSFGHQFQKRLGISHDNENTSPIFLQFLHCVHILVKQNPLQFEFNDDLLKFLADESMSIQYITLAFNCVREREEFMKKDEKKYKSLWDYVLNTTQFINPLYDSNKYSFKMYYSDYALHLDTDEQFLSKWLEYYARYIWKKK